MKIREFASQFTVYVLSQDADLGSKARLSLSQAQYESFFFADFDEMYERVQLAAPHIIVVDHGTLSFELADFFEKILTVSSEIKIIVLTDPQNFPLLNSFQDYNLGGFADRNSETAALQTVAFVDLIAEALFRLYQNEQVYERSQDLQNKLIQVEGRLQEERSGPKVRPFQLRISEYKTSESKEQLMQKFFQQTPNQSWVFLKFIKSIGTYISVAHQNMEESWVEGLSFKVPASDSEFNQKVFLGEFPDSLVRYLKDRWGVESIKMIPLTLKDQVEGILVTTQSISAEVAEDFSLMSLIYQLMSLESQPMHLDVEDALTGFYNELFYRRILDKEIDRSKRTVAPISVVKVAIDSFKEIEVSQGRAFCDEVIKKVAQVIKATSRLPDYACRTGENEFSLVLTNCNRKGAALRAERLRQSLKAESFSRSGFVISVSQGISEYPTLTKTPEALDESAKKALAFIASKGGDKICIFKAPDNHKPDFQVNT